MIIFTENKLATSSIDGVFGVFLSCNARQCLSLIVFNRWTIEHKVTVARAQVRLDFIVRFILVGKHADFTSQIACQSCRRFGQRLVLADEATQFGFELL